MCVTRHPLRYKLRIDRFDELTTAKGWTNDHQRAKHIGVRHTTIGRIRDGVNAPGLRFIVLATSALEVSIDDLFEKEGADR